MSMIPGVPAELSWIFDALMAILLVGLATTTCVSILLLLRPALMLELNQRLSRSVPTAAWFAVLDAPRNLERRLYRYHRALGVFIVLGAGYVLWQWHAVFGNARALAGVLPRLAVPGLDWVAPAAGAIVLLFNSLILVLGVLVAFRPSALKPLEHYANRWVTISADGVLDRSFPGPDATILRHPRASGVLVLAASLWCLAQLLPTVL